ncbi:biotin carboxylase N-terminal domain-containing protein [Paenarthrobacter aurescens]|uniref:biotin carboxylase n=1 Tax=Paenarthrobacter aurescens TaxID=43663 RepID=A0A4Y3NDA2_PAEAU|nr:biotin carboxylase N-terminal domain-containing protein [Paenarthrobacter aurescens]MDO6143043.1 biotin/lipoyl-binding protein [Paenarthrobacter aurescens]MDO6146888.1 biotin/lipoyl-binding protein [Paenarthrobacter aurescens]MDO6158134.1 biotin/lipoyl-binding protein [Paenarthrobacter aurescens]MDO6162119.1 biotin/lipoyl-binding protein [Paenarthrobacter aurescens]GEB19800.1 acetyl/propionyl-CoA carboxylase subuit alpha [Paenarthrobacter aurescens]
MTAPITIAAQPEHRIQARTFGAVLVANRGEIACRVIRTLKDMGIRSVAVYSDADKDAKHVALADTAVAIGGTAPAESYLKIDAIIEACRRSGADAVHPGYGFLSENVEFAKALEAAGITFIGPGIGAIEVMGDKIRSKNHVMAYGVPCVPGIAQPGLSDGELIQAAPDVGFPLLIKPSAGGGGKGMHVVERPEDMASTLATARRVAASAFGDDTLFLERLIRAPRHIEVQVLADNHGNVIHLGERECSLQRRHQKVIEEAPSALFESLPNGVEERARIGEAACNAARSVNYSGAGTVEFLVSDEHPDEFFFMEMNTRLQVEHPVTEMVTGIDLVEWQVRIAAGEVLTVAQSDVVLKGHAVEARVYAEVPERNFMPSMGRVVALAEQGAADAGVSGELPANANVRIDSAMRQNVEITGDYDPMLAKVIAWGDDRAAALETLDAALGRYTLLGVDTNVEYLRLLINAPEVRAGHLDTGLIERRLPSMAFRHVGPAELIAAALTLWLERTGAALAGHAWEVPDAWRVGGRGAWTATFGVPGGGTATVSLTEVASVKDRLGTVTASVDGGDPVIVRVADRGDNRIVVEFDDGPITFAVGRSEDSANNGPTSVRELFLGNNGWSCRLEVLNRAERLRRMLAGIQREDGAADPEVRSPMPGTVVSVSVTDGDTVEAGQALLAVEAMKMEHQLVATVAGTVHLTSKPGDLVKADQVLATIHVDTDSTSTDEEVQP